MAFAGLCAACLPGMAHSAHLHAQGRPPGTPLSQAGAAMCRLHPDQRDDAAHLLAVLLHGRPLAGPARPGRPGHPTRRHRREGPGSLQPRSAARWPACSRQRPHALPAARRASSLAASSQALAGWGEHARVPRKCACMHGDRMAQAGLGSRLVDTHTQSAAPALVSQKVATCVAGRSAAARPWTIAALIALSALLATATLFVPVGLFPPCPPAQMKVRASGSLPGRPPARHRICCPATCNALCGASLRALSPPQGLPEPCCRCRLATSWPLRVRCCRWTPP